MKIVRPAWNLTLIANFFSPPEAQKQIRDFVAFMKARILTPGSKMKTRAVGWQTSFIGMWSGREDLQDSTALGERSPPEGMGKSSMTVTSVDTDILIDAARKHGNGSEMPGTIGANPSELAASVINGNGTSGWLPEQSGIEENRAVSLNVFKSLPLTAQICDRQFSCWALSPQPRIADRGFTHCRLGNFVWQSTHVRRINVIFGFIQDLTLLPYPLGKRKFNQA